MPAKQKYPNLSDDFRVLAAGTRMERGISMNQMAKDIGVFPASISQLEKGQRNFSYDMAVKYRDYLGLDYELPIPRPQEAETITRHRKKTQPIKADAFYISVDGDLIEVVTYRRLGRVSVAYKVELD